MKFQMVTTSPSPSSQEGSLTLFLLHSQIKVASEADFVCPCKFKCIAYMHSATQNQQTTEKLRQKCTLEEKKHPLTPTKQSVILRVTTFPSLCKSEDSSE